MEIILKNSPPSANDNARTNGKPAQTIAHAQFQIAEGTRAISFVPNGSNTVQNS